MSSDGKYRVARGGDRVSAFVVVLKEDMIEGAAEQVADAISLLGAVVSVEPVAADINTLIATSRVRTELFVKIHALFFPPEPTARSEHEPT